NHAETDADVRVGTVLRPRWPRHRSRQADPVAAAQQQGCPSFPRASRRWLEMRFREQYQSSRPQIAALRDFDLTPVRSESNSDEEKLDRFIAKPDEVVPGNNMKPYGGLTSAEDRAKVIVFLESPTTN